jgi:hypothetical protein
MKPTDYILTENTFVPFEQNRPSAPLYRDLLDPVKQAYYKEEKGMVGYITQMTPREYIDAVSNAGGKKEKHLQMDKVNEYAKAMLADVIFPMPDLNYIYYDREEGGLSQEGMHRALAAMSVGVKQMPVFVAHSTPEFIRKAAEKRLSKQKEKRRKEEERRRREEETGEIEFDTVGYPGEGDWLLDLLQDKGIDI